MIGRILIIAMVSGMIAGMGATLFQVAYSVPLILQAELYENAETTPSALTLSETSSLTAIANADGHDDGQEQSQAATEQQAFGGDEWQPADGWERGLYTFAVNVIAGIGFAMLLVGCFTIRNRATDAKVGALWGAAGFATFSFAPYFGLPPELPGMTAADLMDRQIWWIGTVLATAIGLALVVFPVKSVPRGIGVGLGVLIILAPHAIGAPELADHAVASDVPAHLSSKFAVVSLGHGAVLWILLGSIAGWMYGRRRRAHGVAEQRST